MNFWSLCSGPQSIPPTAFPPQLTIAPSFQKLKTKTLQSFLLCSFFPTSHRFPHQITLTGPFIHVRLHHCYDPQRNTLVLLPHLCINLIGPPPSSWAPTVYSQHSSQWCSDNSDHVPPLLNGSLSLGLEISPQNGHRPHMIYFPIPSPSSSPPLPPPWSPCTGQRHSCLRAFALVLPCIWRAAPIVTRLTSSPPRGLCWNLTFSRNLSSAPPQTPIFLVPWYNFSPFHVIYHILAWHILILYT